MAIKRFLALYSQKAGVEVSGEVKENGKKKEGYVQLRFFLLESPTDTKLTQIKFVCEPWECYDLFLKMNKVFRDGGKEKITHKFQKGDTEIVTSITVEKWERNGRGGFGIAAGRTEGFISVPLGMDCASRFLHFAKFLEFLSVQQQWVDN